MTWLEVAFYLTVYIGCVVSLYGLVYFAVCVIRGMSDDDRF